MLCEPQYTFLLAQTSSCWVCPLKSCEPCLKISDNQVVFKILAQPLLKSARTPAEKPLGQNSVQLLSTSLGNSWAACWEEGSRACGGLFCSFWHSLLTQSLPSSICLDLVTQKHQKSSLFQEPGSFSQTWLLSSEICQILSLFNLSRLLLKLPKLEFIVPWSSLVRPEGTEYLH